MAQRLILLGRYEEADDWVERFAPLGPHPGATHHSAGAQLLAAGQPARALGHLTRAQALSPGRPDVEYALGRALLATGRAAEAIPHLRRGFDAGIELPLGGYDLAAALLETGDAGGALEIIRRVRLPEEGSDPELWLRVGRLAVRAGAPELAERYFRHAVRLRPTDAAGRQQLGLNLIVLERCDEAITELSEAARLDPRDTDTFSHLAYCELLRGNRGAARAHAGKALALDGRNRLAQQVAAAAACTTDC